MEIRLFSFSTGRPHPLAEQPVVVITTKSLFLGCNSVQIETVGDFLALLINFEEEQGENEDMFFLVRWKKGETYCVSLQGFSTIPPAITYTLCSASVLRRMGKLWML